ncbi:VC2046/SO_2500 family protein [uncultured Pseudoalteromonas sp.]|uniref:VC2046/SO_2500 family protein n=1 Tax=uncultured Pseudoalteromonas sp. TaxID=114053 RepID=UPI0030C889F3
MQIDGLLITESQLKTRLNKSVHENRRGEFSLLLAMLSHDALDFSQFHLPKSESHSAYVDEEQLRERFGAGPKQLLAPESFDMSIGQEHASVIVQQGEQAGMQAIKLKHCLNPEPLAIRDDKSHIPLPVIDNCELSVRRRLNEKYTSLANPQMDAAAFYDDLTNEAIHKPLLVASA